MRPKHSWAETESKYLSLKRHLKKHRQITGQQRGEDIQKHTSRSETKTAILSWHRVTRLQTDETFTARKEETSRPQHMGKEWTE